MNGIRSKTEPCFELDFFLGARLKRLRNPANHPCEAEKLASGCCSFKTFAVVLIQLAGHLLPWDRRPLNLTMSSASISGNLTLAFILPLRKSLRFVSSAASLQMFSALDNHSESCPWEIPCRHANASCVMFGLFCFSSKYSSTTLALKVGYVWLPLFGPTIEFPSVNFFLIFVLFLRLDLSHKRGVHWVHFTRTQILCNPTRTNNCQNFLKWHIWFGLQKLCQRSSPHIWMLGLDMGCQRTFILAL